MLHRGRVVAEHYGLGQGRGGPAHRFLGVEIDHRAAARHPRGARFSVDPDAPILSLLPEAKGSAYADATIRQALDMQIAIRFH